MDQFILRLPKGGLSTKKKRSPDDRGGESGLPPSKASRGQMYLDFGQRSFSRAQTCDLCGLLYVATDLDDVTEHKRFCRMARAPPTLPITFSNHMQELTSWGNGGGCDEKVVRVGDGKSCEALKKAFLLAENCLGATEQYKVAWKGLYLYLVGRDVAGLLVVDEVVDSAVVELSFFEEVSSMTISDPVPSPPILPNVYLDSSPSSITSPFRKVSLSAHPTTPTPRNPSIRLGVRVIWIHPDYRRREIGHRLIDTARRFQFFGKVLSRQEIAFSQPTEAGFAFALKYSGDRKVRCYPR
eukprot:gene5242-5778_t